MSQCFRNSCAAFFLLVVFSAAPMSPAFAQGGIWGTSLGSSVWGVATSQTLRVCMIVVAIPGLKDNATSASDKRKQSLYFPEMMNESGEVLLRTELQVPNGEFRCVDISYDDLVRAGLEPDPTTGALTLRVRIVTPKGRTSTSGNDETRLVQNDHTEDVGAIMNINSLTGKIELRQIFPPPTSTFVFETTVR